ncbi:hypothetical protein CVT24_010697 [Panaeolus cyanescens]|uniref:F-box domain-containing protein n=1 Tax=Panaeolus cyanescens TaxID=181874 RepID=A0A409YM50_9AGAR|nr:hypothetical protein CVT24_010697 [Panaeolus cyanescens]
MNTSTSSSSSTTSLTPAHTLPTEIWADIFTRVCQHSAHIQSTQHFSVYQRISARVKVHTLKLYLAPFTLSHGDEGAGEVVGDVVGEEWEEDGGCLG